MSSFTSQLESLVKADKSSLDSNVAERRRALNLVRKLQVQLDSPVDTILRLAWQETLYIAGLKSCMDLKVFDILGESSDFIPISELSKRTGANEALLARVLRHVAAMGGIREKEPPLAYASTPFSTALRRKEINAGIDFIFNISAPVATTLPTWLEKFGYKDPLSSDDCCWHIAKRTAFAAHMSGYSEDRGIWLDLYPLSRTLEGAELEGALIVDVGGGRGHDMERFRFRASQQQLGRIIVQDLPLVVDEAKKDQVGNSIEFMAHDFFTPQPVKHARAYYLHSVLHDWQDDDAARILLNLKSAFKPGYSKLIINESVIPNIGVNPILSGLDLLLIGVFNSKERTRDDWEKLLGAAGFHIVNEYTDTTVAYESVIEADVI